MFTRAQPHNLADPATATADGGWTPEMVESMFMLGAYRLPSRGKTFDAWAYMDWDLEGPGWSINIDMRLNPNKTVWDCHVQSFTKVDTEPKVRTFDRMTRAEAFAKMAELANMLTRAATNAHTPTRALAHEARVLCARIGTR